MNRCGLIGLSVCLALTGCGVSGGTSVFTGGSSGTIDWSDPIDPGKPSPFDTGTVSYLGTTLVVWANERANGSGRSFSHGSDGMKLESHLRFSDGKMVEVQCVSKDGKTGAVTVAGQTFELGDGNLFLVTGPGDRPRVKQLKRDLSGVDLKSRKSLQAFGAADAEIVAFFTQK